jgi:hypothetical protein
MSKQTLFAALIAIGLVCISTPTLPAFAQGPVAYQAYLDNQWHTIGPGSTQWYAFDRADDHTAVTVTLVNGVALGLVFKVYAPDKNDQAIGRGTSSNVICNSQGDKCASPDLTWTGGASSAGRYNVQVTSNGTNATSFLLTLTGGSATPIPSYGYYYPPYGVPYSPPYAPPYGQPYYGVPYTPYIPPYYGPGYVAPYRPYCPPGYFPGYPPGYAPPWYCR